MRKITIDAVFYLSSFPFDEIVISGTFFQKIQRTVAKEAVKIFLLFVTWEILALPVLKESAGIFQAVHLPPVQNACISL